MAKSRSGWAERFVLSQGAPAFGWRSWGKSCGLTPTQRRRANHDPGRGGLLPASGLNPHAGRPGASERARDLGEVRRIVGIKAPGHRERRDEAVEGLDGHERVECRMGVAREGQGDARQAEGRI